MWHRQSEEWRRTGAGPLRCHSELAFYNPAVGRVVWPMGGQASEVLSGWVGARVFTSTVYAGRDAWSSISLVTDVTGDEQNREHEDRSVLLLLGAGSNPHFNHSCGKKW